MLIQIVTYVIIKNARNGNTQLDIHMLIVYIFISTRIRMYSKLQKIISYDFQNLKEGNNLALLLKIDLMRRIDFKFEIGSIL